MKTLRWFGLLGMAVVLGASPAGAQEPPKPGPEHELLKKWVGTWDTTMKMPGDVAEVKGVATYKMELGGLWLASSHEGEFGGMKFQGRGLDSYDAAKKKYVSVFVDNMSTSPLVMEGTYDKAKKILTMEGEGPGMDGKPTKYKTLAEWKDDNTVVFTMYMGGAKEKESAFTITYKRRK
jgi:hypothetical protein